jgi:hypothetical protein
MPKSAVPPEQVIVMNAERQPIPFGRPSVKRRDSANAGRTCAEVGCDTVLSRYNKTDRCGVHEPKLSPAERRTSK